jgi:sulfopyruvate decarboxylase TPP-binding subunit
LANDVVTASQLARALARECDFFAVLPDSKSAALIVALRDFAGQRVIQVGDEATAVGIAAGLTLVSRSCLLIMESSGLRRGFESLGRLSASHGIHPLILATDRGAIGDSDWWAAAHQPHARSVATALGAVCADLTSDLAGERVASIIAGAVRHHRSQQVPVVLWAAPDLIKPS